VAQNTETRTRSTPRVARVSSVRAVPSDVLKISALSSWNVDSWVLAALAAGAHASSSAQARTRGRARGIRGYARGEPGRYARVEIVIECP